MNQRPEALDAAIAHASGGRISTPVEWRSPLASDDFAEYRDGAFLDLLGIDAAKSPLRDFWPRYGPQWDALGLSGRGEPVLIEAKANIPEVISPPTGSAGASRALIERSLAETAGHLGVRSSCDWSGTFYQYANRLAHLYYLNELLGVDAWLVFIYFIGDQEVGGPATEAEWRTALEVLHGALGLRRHRMLGRRVEVFVEVGPEPR